MIIFIVFRKFLLNSIFILFLNVFFRILEGFWVFVEKCLDGYELFIEYNFGESLKRKKFI